MTLLEPYVYYDPKGLSWNAPAGSVIDGASIPRQAWSIIGGPYEGLYRFASVIHDVACDQKKRAWEDVHENFYFGMRASGVGEIKAKLMFAAVYNYGPRWPRFVYISGTDAQQVDQALAAFQRSLLPGEELGSVTIKLPNAEFEPPKPGPQTQLESLGRELPLDRPNSLHQAYVVVNEVRPPSQRLTPAQFETLTRAIEERNLSIEEIKQQSLRSLGAQLGNKPSSRLDGFTKPLLRSQEPQRELPPQFPSTK